MKLLKRAGIAVLPLALCGCLEVNQHPAWLEGGYAGKIDQLPYQQLFHRDRLAWSAAIANRTLHQNEYVRAKPPGMVGYIPIEETGATPQENIGPAGGASAGAAPAGGASMPPAAVVTPPAGTAQPEPGAASPAAAAPARPPRTR